ncbi:MAG: diguanylate cyclase and metal dependent phosphohydrolase [Peptococcaceae bacterium]|uniref:HD domain-containing protein n=1 Tax=Thermanaerosceptrum fracticalcis TaxID=1712410 RepID=A0A7G6E7V7_THEFR|nr:HD-GYP domain-containing protein [Thermanaerosceptrum fracticalcis]MBZ4654763.1 diguanylate cyclase and metal dependent phosphohydrolase [Peptococcaceae bacterium]QNB48161.1 HD domain-containing protein [Thermanaerosceptrum fracticalcis]
MLKLAKKWIILYNIHEIRSMVLYCAAERRGNVILASVQSDSLKAMVKLMELRDISTYIHCNKVAQYSKILAAKISLSESEVELVTKSALIHDIGKMGIPEKILYKPGKLTDIEYEIIKKHTVLAIDTLSSTGLNDLIPSVVHHHEWYNGQGYPTGLKGPNIPLYARIIAVADVYDALTSPRVYRPTLTVEEAKKELLRVAGSQLDPELVREFLEMEQILSQNTD